MTNNYWSKDMQAKHERQLAAHVQAVGPLGELTKAGQAKLAKKLSSAKKPASKKTAAKR